LRLGSASVARTRVAVKSLLGRAAGLGPDAPRSLVGLYFAGSPSVGSAPPRRSDDVTRIRDLLASVGDLRLSKERRAAAREARRRDALKRSELADENLARKAAAAAEAQRYHGGGTTGYGGGPGF
jgi:hypothetical protein